MIEPTAKQLKEAEYQAMKAEREGTDYECLTYEQGFWDCLQWLRNEGDNPYEFEGTPLHEVMNFR